MFRFCSDKECSGGEVHALGVRNPAWRQEIDAHIEIVQLFWELPEVILIQEHVAIWELMIQVHKLEFYRQKIAWRELKTILKPIDDQVEAGKPVKKSKLKHKK